jgi:peptide/nickel transport system permease protein
MTGTVSTTTARASRPRPIAGSVVLGAILVLTIVALVTLVPLLSGYDPYGQDLMSSLAPPLNQGDERQFWLGSDALGRDVLSRLALAGRISLGISISAVAISLTIGLVTGTLAGFFGGMIDTAVTSLADLQLSVPRVLLLIAAAALSGPSATTLTILIGITGWASYCRVARALTLSLRSRDYVQAAVTLGTSPASSIRQHILPNVLPHILILATFDLGQVIVLEASMSYLGLGVQPPLPSWGGMMSEGQNYLEIAPWIALAPGFAVFLIVAGVQLVSQHLTAEGKADALASTMLPP